jgi:hypothetical protein
VAGFAGFVAGGLTPERQAALLGAFDSTEFCGHPEVRWPLPPSTSPGEAGFNARSYWRGPTWPFMHLLFWLSLREIGEAERAEALRQVSLAQIASAGFAEYIEPFTGEPLGSGDQSWTAAAVIEWLAAANEGTTA